MDISLIILLFFLTKVSGRTDSAESTVGEGLLSTLGRGHAVGKGEPDTTLGKLSTVGPVELTGSKSGSTDDLDGTRTTTVTSSHLIVQLGDSTDELHITVLAVHVVGSRSGVVTEPDSVVFDAAAVLLDDLDAVKDLTGGLLHLTELTHEVPELGLGGDVVRGEDNHAVCLGVGVFGGACLTADNLILAHLSSSSHDFYLVWCKR